LRDGQGGADGVGLFDVDGVAVEVAGLVRPAAIEDRPGPASQFRATAVVALM
jgi:hypothetical protein